MFRRGIYRQFLSLSFSTRSSAVKIDHKKADYVLQLQSFATKHDAQSIANLILQRHSISPDKNTHERILYIVRDAVEISGWNERRFNAKLYSSILESISVLMPDAAKIGFEKLAIRSVNSNQDLVILDIIAYMAKLDIRFSPSVAEQILIYLSRVGRIDGIIAMCDLCDHVSSPMLQAIVQPLFLSGCFDEFSKYFRSYVHSKNPPSADEVTVVVQNIILADCRCTTQSPAQRLALTQITDYVEYYLQKHGRKVFYTDLSSVKTSLKILKELLNNNDVYSEPCADDALMMIPAKSEHMQFNLIMADHKSTTVPDLTDALKLSTGPRMLFAGSLFPVRFNDEYVEAIRKLESTWGVLFRFDRYHVPSYDAYGDKSEDSLTLRRRNTVAEIVNDLAFDFDDTEIEYDEDDSSQYNDPDIEENSDVDDVDSMDANLDDDDDIPIDDEYNLELMSDKEILHDRILMSERLSELGSGDFDCSHIIDISQQLNSEITYVGRVFVQDSSQIAEHIVL